MSHLNSVRLPVTVIFTALLVIILVSSSHTTYELAPAKKGTLATGGYTLASCDTKTVTIARPIEPPRVCPWPRRKPLHRSASAMPPRPETGDTE